MENGHGQNCEVDAARRCRGRPQVRSDEVTRHLIIEAARQEFQANGYAATCIANVAQRACVSTKTLYRLIPTKAELFRSVVSERIGRFVLVLERELDGLDSLDAAEVLERMLTAFGTLTLDPGPIAITRLVIGECGGFPEIATAFYESAIKRTSDVMEHALSRLCQRGLIAVDDPREAIGHAARHDDHGAAARSHARANRSAWTGGNRSASKTLRAHLPQWLHRASTTGRGHAVWLYVRFTLTCRAPCPCRPAAGRR